MVFNEKTYWQTISAIVVAVGGMITANYTGIAAAVNDVKAYTDAKTQALEEKINDISRFQSRIFQELELIKRAMRDDLGRKTKKISDFGR